MDLSTCEQVIRPVNSNEKAGYTARECSDLQLGWYPCSQGEGLLQS